MEYIKYILILYSTNPVRCRCECNRTW